MTDLENKEAFEKAIIALCGFNPETALEKSEITGDYKSDAIYFSWVMWNASAQRQGFKFLPLEPSEETVKTIANYLCKTRSGTALEMAKQTYKAMIDAV